MKVGFVGPSLYPWGKPRLPGKVEGRGPARNGDVARAVRDGATVIALIDGYYGSVAAVWHKEILFALSKGVRVLGGASIGAIRAAECEFFGMEGVGDIFQDYRSGALMDDGAVALLHAPEDLDYMPLTEPLVDIEATLHTLQVENLLEPHVAQCLLTSAVETFFEQRTLETIVARAGFMGREAGRLVEGLEHGRVRLKKADALAVLQRAAELPDERDDRPKPWSPAATRAWRLLSGE